MKLTPTVLALSLAANAALVAFLVLRAAPDSSDRASASAAPGASDSASTSRARSPDALRTALATGDAAALQAAGLSPEAIRELTVGRSFVRALERIRAARAAQSNDNRWWRNQRGPATSRELQLQTRREIADALAAAGLGDLNLFAADNQAEQLAFLSPEKRDALRRITQDYDEMMAKFSAGGVQLPSDRERLKLLRAERDRDIASLLSPSELADYELRTSPTSNSLRARYGDAIQSEDDFKKLYALQKAFDEKYSLDATSGRLNQDTLRQRAEASRQLQDDFRNALGADKYTAFQRASDPDLRTVDSLVSRLNLPPQTTDRVATARDTYAAESQRINANPTLTPQDRRTQIQALGNRAKSELTQTLGTEGADAYAQRSPWVSMLQGGMAYTTTPSADAPGLPFGGVPSVHPVPPPGTAGPGANRQTFTIATPIGTDVIATDAHGGGAGIPSGGMRVMTFSTSESTTTDPTGTAPSAGTRRGLATPPGETPPTASRPPDPKR